VTNPSHAYVFVSFCKAGTTSMVFEEYRREKNNSENKNKISEDQLTKLKDVLKDLKWKKHRQKKITRIEKGLELCISDKCCCFVITNDRAINITQGVESYLTSEHRSRILKSVFSRSHDEVLTKDEVELLNNLLKNQRDTFDFHKKKVAFITGSAGSRFLSKADFFTKIKYWLDAGSVPSVFTVLLTEEEKYKSGGYDVFVLLWVKVFSIRQKKRMIERLNSNQ